MSGRPEILFPLFASLETLPGIGEKTAKLLENLDVETPRDLLFTLPHAVIDRQPRDTIEGLSFPTVVTVAVTIGAHRKPRTVRYRGISGASHAARTGSRDLRPGRNRTCRSYRRNPRSF